LRTHSQTAALASDVAVISNSEATMSNKPDKKKATSHAVKRPKMKGSQSSRWVGVAPYLSMLGATPRAFMKALSKQLGASWSNKPVPLTIKKTPRSERADA